MQGIGMPNWFITPEGDLVSAFSYNALSYNPYWGTTITSGGKTYTPEKWHSLSKHSKTQGTPSIPTTSVNPDDAVKNLSNVNNPTVPQFITPYQNVTRGFGAFGERDVF